jgi:RNA polymerase primary sigma factor
MFKNKKKNEYYENYSVNNTIDMDIESLQIFIGKVRNYPLLTKQQEKDLTIIIYDYIHKKNNNKKLYKETMNKLIRGNIRLVITIAKHYQHQGLPYIDLIQEGLIGLIIAINNFDPHKNFRLSTFCTYQIRATISRALINKGLLIRVPLDVAAALKKIDRKYIEVEEEDGSYKLNIKEIDTILNKNKINEYYNYFKNNYKSGDELVKAKGFNDDFFTEFDNNNNISSEDDTFEKKYERKDIINYLYKFVDEREKQILAWRYGIGGEEKSYREISKILDVSYQRVYEIERRALKRLKKIDGIKELYYSN